VGVHVPQPWNVVSPKVVRYENEEWIEAFFDDGSLRLTSFKKFATYGDEARGDAMEGFGSPLGFTNSGQTIGVVMRQGMDAYVLCASHRLDEALRVEFERNSAFLIVDPVGFGLSIASVLPGFMYGFEGSCRYAAERGIRRRINADMEAYRQPDGSISMDFMQSVGAQLGGPELMLLKRKKYTAQQEYRLVWMTHGEAQEHIDIKCPDARQFCRRLLPLDWNPELALKLDN